MSPDTLHLVVAIAVPLAAGAAAYGGVRAGMAALTQRVTQCEADVRSAHRRIDRLVDEQRRLA